MIKMPCSFDDITNSLRFMFNLDKIHFLSFMHICLLKLCRIKLNIPSALNHLLPWLPIIKSPKVRLSWNHQNNWILYSCFVCFLYCSLRHYRFCFIAGNPTRYLVVISWLFQDLLSVTAERELAAEATGLLFSVSPIKALGVKMENVFATVVYLAMLITICHRIITYVFNFNIHSLFTLGVAQHKEVRRIWLYCVTSSSSHNLSVSLLSISLYS